MQKKEGSAISSPPYPLQAARRLDLRARLETTHREVRLLGQQLTNRNRAKVAGELGEEVDGETPAEALALSLATK